MLNKIFSGSLKYWGILAGLFVLVAIGLSFYILQWNVGLGITGMSRDVSWGLYIANFTFFVGVAASAVMLVLPYYLHHQKAFTRIIIFGEFLAVAAVIVAGSFVLVDLGQPTRVFNMLLNPSPNSLLFWDMMVLTVYLFINILIGWATLDAENKGEAPRAWVKPLILISIPWAISIHTVTAFIYCGMAGRPFWLTALLAPRFLASAFASGPALLILLALIIKKIARYDFGAEAIKKLRVIVTYAAIATVFFIILEIFTVFYSQMPEHLLHFQYLLFGLGESTKLVPWFWTSFILLVFAIAVLVNPATHNKEVLLTTACLSIFIAIWIDKGLGLVIPGFIPSQNGVVFEYWPSVPEIFITTGVWAMGAMILMLLYKIALSVKQAN